LTPVLHFSNLMTPRGTIIMLGTAGIIAGIVGVVIGLPDMVGIIPIMLARSIVIEEETTEKLLFTSRHVVQGAPVLGLAPHPALSPAGRGKGEGAAAVFFLQLLMA
jgi:hypothetical protein